jgi:hypothetical protein
MASGWICSLRPVHYDASHTLLSQYGFRAKYGSYSLLFHTNETYQPQKLPFPKSQKPTATVPLGQLGKLNSNLIHPERRGTDGTEASIKLNSRVYWLNERASYSVKLSQYSRQPVPSLEPCPSPLTYVRWTTNLALPDKSSFWVRLLEVNSIK